MRSLSRKLGEATLASVNGYVTIIEIDMTSHGLPPVSKIAIYLKENNVNAVDYKVDGTFDGTNYQVIKAETEIAKNAEATELPSAEAKYGDPWYKVRVQIKSSVGDTHGNVTATVYGD